MNATPQSPQPAAPQPDPITTAAVSAAQAGGGGHSSGPPPVQRIIVQHTSGSRIGRLLGWAGWAGFLFCGVLLLGVQARFSDYFHDSEGVTEKYHSGDRYTYGADKVAIIKVSGVIMEGDGFVKRQIERVLEDEHVKAVVLRVDSPGGTVTGSDYIYHHLKELRSDRDPNLPIVVSMGSVAASGGYYVSMAVGDKEKTIYAEPTCITGSIGVIIPHYDLSGLLQEKLNVTDDSIASHPRKQMLSMTKKIPPEHREILQAHVNESFERFKDIVKEGRPKFSKDPAALNELATGEIFSAEQAKKNGLVDEIGFLEDAVLRAIELAKLDKDKVRVVKYERPATLSGLVGLAEAKQPGFDLSALLDLTAPRAYYLSSTLPTLVTSKRAD